MKTLLLVQFRTDKSLYQERKCFLKLFSKKDTTIRFFNAFERKINWSLPEKITKDIRGVILGGSGQFYFSVHEKEKQFQKMLQRISPFVRFLLKKDFPTLGICFGHQIIGYFLGEKAMNDPLQAETGSFYVYLNKNGLKSPLFLGIPKKFVAQFGHKDSLEKLPKGAKLLAKSKRCKICIFSYKENIFGVQFHPEMTLEDIKLRLKLYPEYKSKKLNLLPSPYSQKILENFYNLC
jgi:GMP synthase (glutamine-hydrolysing)